MGFLEMAAAAALGVVVGMVVCAVLAHIYRVMFTLD
jgi:hypothetical protein